MSNSLVQAYRDWLRSQGQPDDERSDFEITQSFGDELRAKGDFETEHKFPDFRDDYLDIQNRSGRGLLSETIAGVKTAGKSLAGTAVGAVGLLSDFLPEELDEHIRDPLIKTASGLLESAGVGGPTITDVGDVRSVGEGLRFGFGVVGQVLPSVTEAIATGAIGAGIGSGLAPGPGTVAGALAGATGKQTVKRIIKKAIDTLTKQGIWPLEREAI